MITPIDPSADKYPDSKAIILYDNVLTIGGKVVTKNTYEYEDATYISDPQGDRFFSDASAATATSIDCVAVLVNNSINTSADIALFNNSVEVATASSEIDGGVIMVSFDSVEADLVAVTFQDEVEVVYISAGQCLKMTQPIYGGHAPIALSSNTKYDSAKSVNGNFIGRTIERQGGETQFNWRNLDPNWYRSTFQSFVEHAKSNPFFIKWRPDYHSDEASYCWTTQDVKPQNQGGGTQLMSVNMSVECYDGV